MASDATAETAAATVLFLTHAAEIEGMADASAVAGMPAPISVVDQTIYCPPFAVSVEPVMKPASSDARNTTQRAISSGSPRRPSGICGRVFFSSRSLWTALTHGVAI